jgi:predicted RNA-binding protein with PIN domain
MQEHLIIDGNNALHAIPELARELRNNREYARESLLHLLEPLVGITSSLLTVVFDGKGGPLAVSKHKELEAFTVIYSSSTQGADGVIERMLMASKQPEKLVVVTNDNLIRNCAFAHGASAMRVEEVSKKLDFAIERVKSIRCKTSKKSNENGAKFENKIPFPD